MSDALNQLSDLIAKARKSGADAADAILIESRSESVGVRLGNIEDVERSESSDLGLRVFIGKRQAIVSSTDLSSPTLDAMVSRAIAMAQLAPEDPYCGLAETSLLAQPPFPALDLADSAAPTTDELLTRARTAEDAALAVKGITNSEGGGASWGFSRVSLVASNGFAGTYAGTSHSVSVSVLAGTDTAMERDYDYSSTRHLADLADPATVGRSAGERTVRRLNPKKPKSAKVPVVFDPRVSRTLLGHLSSAINGQAIARGTSFLKDKLNAAIFAPGVAVIDDPLLTRGLSSRPFDGEGVVTRRLAVVENGVLQSWLLDSASAKQLKLVSTGHARRGTSGPPSPGTSNFYLAAGKVSPAELMADIKSGFYVTELIGMGVNGVTGDYSRGASGFWIENGELAYPVSELTIAGNLISMFAALVPANDLEFRYGTDAPTVRIDGMTLAGS
ncbi:MAG: TldD/PmbA family protein [Sphingomonadales bacterium]|nr:TldD/PmbA family protein [Sphingomonadales bacterium]